MRLDQVKLCNCADCRIRLLGESQVAWYEALDVLHQAQICKQLRLDQEFPMVTGRILGRPYCCRCLAEKRQVSGGAGVCARDDVSPGAENAVKAWEEST